MEYNKEIEDIKLKIQDLKNEIKCKRKRYKLLTGRLNNIDIENLTEDPSLEKKLEIKATKQDILNEIAGEKIGGISQYYYDKLQEERNYKAKQIQLKLDLQQDIKIMAQTILEEIENLKAEENKLLNECQSLINKSKQYKKQNTGITAPRTVRRTR